MNRATIAAEVRRIRERLGAKGNCSACGGRPALLHIDRLEDFDGRVIEQYPPPAPCRRCGNNRVLNTIVEQLVRTKEEAEIGRRRAIGGDGT
jgi:hypothetical protein